MESNSDKQMREKLQGVEFPFDPHAWEKMEAMLDNKKKRRGFFWWWFGGIAAGVVLFTLVGYQLGKQAGTRQLATAHNTATTATKPASSTSAITGNSNSTHTTGTTNAPATTNTTTHSNTATTAIQQPLTQTKGNTNTAAQQGTANNAPGTGYTTNYSPAPIAKSSRAPGKKQSKLANTAATPAAGQNPGGQQPFISSTPAVETPTAEATAVATPAQRTEVEALQAMLPGLLTANTLALFAEKSETASLPKKAKVFQYSLGPVANVTGTLLNQPAVADTGQTHRGFAAKPSFMVGLQQQFLFINRIAFTTSVMYSQTSFTVSPAKSTGNPYIRVPKAYTSNLSEVTITTGIKANLVAKPTFNFYVNTGFIHHIKLKENFNYTYAPIDTPDNLTSTGGQNNATNTLPTFTDFENNTKEMVVYDMLGTPTTTTTVNTAPFSVNNARRYYTSFYAGVGAEYIHKSRWAFFAEPMFFMGLQQIGIQERRKYNVGLSGGMRYRF